MLPEPWCRDWSREETSELVRAMVQRKAIGPPSGLGMMLAAPTIMTHGSEELKQRLLPQIFNGQHGWCQLFSEPGAGSDLAGLQCQIGRAHVELQSLMRISYAVFCLKQNKITQLHYTVTSQKQYPPTT